MEKSIGSLVRTIVSRTDPLEIRVFGSLARDEFTDASDIDIAIIYPSNDARRNARTAILAAAPILTWPVDYLFLTIDHYKRYSDMGGVCSIIAAEGKSLYRKK